jgi:exopolysaccharide biosynthesis polyprenyl glycosylphosphotransferase
MFSPKKESCIKALASSSEWAVPFGRLGDGAHDHIFSRDPVPLRDKALPDRLVVTTLVCDSLVIVYALIFAYWFRFQTAFSEFGFHAPPNLHAPTGLQEYSGYISLGALTLILTLTSFGIYERNVLLRFHFVSSQIVKASFLWAAGFLSFVMMFRFEPPISRLFIASATILTPGALLAWRWLLHRYLRRSAVAVNLRQRIIFVGWNQESEDLTETFAQDPSSAYEVVGCIGSTRARFQRKPKVRTLGGFDDLVEVIHRMAVDMVILTDVNCVKGEIVSLANICEREMIQFKVVPSYFQILVSGLHLETVAGIPILGVTRLPLDRVINIAVKRLVDIVGSIVGLLVSFPLLVVFGAIVSWESPGPIFYRQRRLGRNGVEFDILKIRSMRLNAEEAGKVGWTTKNDPRRLKVGAFMRRWNIDEVPQFWNVLKGEMSLVGPRPERPELIHNFKHEIPHYNARHNAKPGITGWAQVKGLRGDTDLTERIKCDLWYLENWSLVLDFQIMLLTFLKREHAC